MDYDAQRREGTMTIKNKKVPLSRKINKIARQARQRDADPLQPCRL
ncbi:hypothetical protein C4K40_3319 [Pseudomonas sp. CMR5c]|nr:hypothetical protein C4K40_3319 [Pseudomonas sp. CMR5c]